MLFIQHDGEPDGFVLFADVSPEEGYPLIRQQHPEYVNLTLREATQAECDQQSALYDENDRKHRERCIGDAKKRLRKYAIPHCPKVSAELKAERDAVAAAERAEFEATMDRLCGAD